MNASLSVVRQTGLMPVLRTSLIGGAIAGSLDLVFAFTYYGLHGIPPIRILQSIASGLLGMSSFTGGMAAACIGVACHYFILVVATFLYLTASRYAAILIRHAVACGLLYGAAIYVVMHFVVVPLSAAPPFKPTAGAVFAELGSHLFLVGLSIALVVRRHFQCAAS